jgi:hypothetical protein
MCLYRDNSVQNCSIVFVIVSLNRYLIMGLILNNIAIFLLVITASTVDFWIVKNVTGRSLIGMKWGNYHNEDG